MMAEVCVLCFGPLPAFPATLVREPYDELGPLCDRHPILLAAATAGSKEGTRDDG